MNRQQHPTGFLFTIFCCIMLSGCNSSTSISDPADNPDNSVTNVGTVAVFVVTESGGCVRIGPNCAQHTLYSNGKVEVKRNDSDAVEAQGTIDSGQLNSWQDLVANTDFDALKVRLPEGSCAGCVDGIDYKYTIYPQSSPIQFDSIEHKFDQAEPFFAMTAGIVEAMRNAAPLEIRSHVR